MVIAQLKHYPYVCRLCLKHPDPSTDQMVTLKKQEDSFHGTIEDYIGSITFNTSGKAQLFPQEVCLPCLKMLRFHAKYQTKVINISLLFNAFIELKYSCNKIPLEDLFRTKGTSLQELFKELHIFNENDINAADLIDEFKHREFDSTELNANGKELDSTELVIVDELTLGQEIEHVQDEPPSDPPADLPKKRGRPRKEIITLSCRQRGCTEVFHDRKSFEHHRWTAHKGFVCEECGQQCASKHSLDIHIARHRNKEEFQCASCARLFNVKKDLVYHIKQIHTAREKFRCEDCGLEYKHKTTFESHLLTHKEEYGFPCTDCDKKFKAKRILNSHIYRVHSELSLPCDKCGKLFRNRFDLLNHIEKTHGIQCRFPCDVCVKPHSNAEDLAAHRLRHDNPKELECGLCLVAFLSAEEMADHLCITYRDDYTAPSSKSVPSVKSEL